MLHLKINEGFRVVDESQFVGCDHVAFRRRVKQEGHGYKVRTSESEVPEWDPT